jgi:hypothetical protein
MTTGGLQPICGRFEKSAYIYPEAFFVLVGFGAFQNGHELGETAETLAVVD